MSSGGGGGGVENANNIASVAMSARYPRVAVLLGVQPRWHVPLLLCRALSTVSAAWWACQTCFSIYQLISDYDTNTGIDTDTTAGGDAATGGGSLLWEHRIFRRLAVAQVGLSFLWAGAAAYLAHLFASSLMARWLLHYSPLAVLVRLCSLSIVLSFGCLQVFRATGATRPDLLQLSRSLLAWIAIAVALMLAYFCTQHDLFVAAAAADPSPGPGADPGGTSPRDNEDAHRRRRQILRLKCLYVVSACSLCSLLVLVGIVQLDPETGVLDGFITAVFGHGNAGESQGCSYHPSSSSSYYYYMTTFRDCIGTCKALASDMLRQWRRFADGTARFGAEL
ncbi:hypothetical protein AYL99_11067 [Fonsecaea erecta]|uniref:Uncharacterized protein n=1 Tax=Fonsecaea erecta TaxID=1367422 RepID=A0A178Z4F0_9EURO|nr:hypothetical protein AYL99_11067 [Fonsecaea erecta]OAP54619.1 hypothetical protein AYL99_11067 [Fonsecaea erecta]